MKSILAATAAFTLSATMSLADIGDTVERQQFDRAMGSADTLLIDDGDSVRRTGCASMRDCFDKIRKTEPGSENGTIIGDVYRHGRSAGSYECGYFEDTQNNECREIRRAIY